MSDEKFSELATYSNRMTYVLAQGRPAAQIGVYVPTMSMWLGDNSSNASMMKVAQGLLENQRDYDFVDEAALASNMKLQGPEFINASGQAYRAIIVPACTAISKTSIDRLALFAKAGGKVIFLGKEPALIVEKTFLNATTASDPRWASLREPSGEVNDKVLATLPKPDVVLDQSDSNIKFMHRKWRDADVYFAFNESDQKQSCQVSLAGNGQAQVWNASDGTIEKIEATPVRDGVKLPLELGSHEARLIVIGANALVASR